LPGSLAQVSEDLKATVQRAYMDTLSRMDLALCNAVSEFAAERYSKVGAQGQRRAGGHPPLQPSTAVPHGYSEAAPGAHGGRALPVPGSSACTGALVRRGGETGALVRRGGAQGALLRRGGERSAERDHTARAKGRCSSMTAVSAPPRQHACRGLLGWWGMLSGAERGLG
jgi:hypothetical protein